MWPTGSARRTVRDGPVDRCSLRLLRLHDRTARRLGARSQVSGRRSPALHLPVLQLLALVGLPHAWASCPKAPSRPQGIGLVVLFPLAVVSNALVPTEHPTVLRAVCRLEPHQRGDSRRAASSSPTRTPSATGSVVAQCSTAIGPPRSCGSAGMLAVFARSQPTSSPDARGARSGTLSARLAGSRNGPAVREPTHGACGPSRPRSHPRPSRKSALVKAGSPARSHRSCK